MPGDLELLLQLGALVQRRLVLAIQILALDLELPLLEGQRRHDGLVALLEAVDDRVRDGPDVVAGVVDLAPRVARAAASACESACRNISSKTLNRSPNK